MKTNQIPRGTLQLQPSFQTTDKLRSKFKVSDKGVTKSLEAVVRRCSSKWLFLKISQNSLENTCVSI